MTTVLLATTHVLAFGLGAGVAWFVTLRAGGVTPDMHPHHEEGRHVPPHTPPDRKDRTLPLIAIIASVVLLAVGAQAWLAARENAQRDARDAAYAQCLTAFAEKFVDAVEARTQVGLRVQRARDRLENARAREDDLLDRLIEISLAAQSSGAQSEEDLPPAMLREYRQVLRDRVEAQKEASRRAGALEQIEMEAEATRQDNPYVSPRVLCER